MIAPKLNLDLMIPSLFGVKFKVLHGELNLIDLKTRCVCVWKGGGGELTCHTFLVSMSLFSSKSIHIWSQMKLALPTYLSNLEKYLRIVLP